MQFGTNVFHGSFDWSNSCCCHGTGCKKRKVLNFMMLLIGSVQLFGSIFSVSNYFDRRVTDWEVVYIPYITSTLKTMGFIWDGQSL